MTHSVHPYSHRLGIIRDWKSRWFGKDSKYQEMLRGDIVIRTFLKKKLRGFLVDVVEIERGEGSLRLIIKTARPGLMIGRSGEGVAKLKQDILREMNRKKIVPPQEFKVDVEEVKEPDTKAAIVGQMVAEGLEKRLPFRRVIKQAVERVMTNRGVSGVKITISGRLGGAEMSRRESAKDGRIPLQTVRADIDFAREVARLPYGIIGVKVWIYRGEVFDEAEK